MLDRPDEQTCWTDLLYRPAGHTCWTLVRVCRVYQSIVSIQVQHIGPAYLSSISTQHIRTACLSSMSVHQQLLAFSFMRAVGLWRLGGQVAVCDCSARGRAAGLQSGSSSPQHVHVHRATWGRRSRHGERMRRYAQGGGGQSTQQPPKPRAAGQWLRGPRPHPMHVVGERGIRRPTPAWTHTRPIDGGPDRRRDAQGACDG